MSEKAMKPGRILLARMLAESMAETTMVLKLMFPDEDFSKANIGDSYSAQCLAGEESPSIPDTCSDEWLRDRRKETKPCIIERRREKLDEARDKWRETWKDADLDPWAHRSKGMKCSTCMWFVKKIDSMESVVPNEKGRCRRHAPTMGGYPVVFTDDWCGDHKLA